MSITCLLIAISVLGGTVSGLEGDAGGLSVRRGEYANALSQMHDLDDSTRTAYMIMAGDLEGAARSLSGAGEALPEAFVSSMLGDWARTLESTAGRMDNPWLEIYRIYLRSSAFYEMGMYDSLAVATSFLDDEKDLEAKAGGHPALEALHGLRARGLVESGREVPPKVLSRAFAGELENDAAVSLCSAMLDSRRLEDAARIAAGIRPGGLEDEKRELLGKCLDGIAHMAEGLDDELLERLAGKAVSAGESGAAERLISELGRRPENRWKAEMLSGSLMERRRWSRRAARIYNDLFESQAPVEIKREALLRKASVEYSLGRHRRSADVLRMFAGYYPGDHRVERSLDRAARIYLAVGDRGKAIETWTMLSGMEPETRVGRAGVVSLAALQVSLGRRSDAREALGSLAGSGRSAGPEVMYWMYRASDDPDSASAWIGRLRAAYPLSSYSCAAGGEEDWLRAVPPFRHLDIELMERSEAEHAEYASNGGAAADRQGDDALLDAFEYFCGWGLLDEASSLARVLCYVRSTGNGRLWRVYSLSREKGMAGTALMVLDVIAAREPGSVPDQLRYPVTFTGIISRTSERRAVPPALVLSVIREESRFDVEAVSPAGALGLMQIMPSTGDWIGGKLGEKDVDRDLIFTPVFNIEAGTWYLRFLLDRAEDSVVGAVAAFNAGNSRMKKWRKAFRPWDDPMVAMEMIGLRETREYVRRVLDSYAAYLSLYGEAGDVR